MSRCITEPVSFLRLERYLLGELPEGEHARIAEHLAACAVCRDSYAGLCESDVQLPPLPARAREIASERLPDRTRLGFSASASVPAGASAPRPLRARVVALLAPLALAALALLVLRPGWLAREGASQAPGASTSVKGGELVLKLVRERDGQLALDPEVFGEGDRFQAQISCPPGPAQHWDLVVYQDGRSFFPLHPMQRIVCRNELTLDGAFRLTGDAPARVCVVLSERAPLDRTILSQGPRALNSPSACVTLNPTRR